MFPQYPEHVLRANLEETQSVQVSYACQWRMWSWFATTDHTPSRFFCPYTPFSSSRRMVQVTADNILAGRVRLEADDSAANANAVRANLGLNILTGANTANPEPVMPLLLMPPTGNAADPQARARGLGHQGGGVQPLLATGSSDLRLLAQNASMAAQMAAVQGRRAEPQQRAGETGPAAAAALTVPATATDHDRALSAHQTFEQRKLEMYRQARSKYLLKYGFASAREESRTSSVSGVDLNSSRSEQDDVLHTPLPPGLRRRNINTVTSV